MSHFPCHPLSANPRKLDGNEVFEEQKIWFRDGDNLSSDGRNGFGGSGCGKLEGGAGGVGDGVRVCRWGQRRELDR